MESSESGGFESGSPICYSIRVIGEGSDSDIEIEYTDLEEGVDRNFLLEVQRDDRRRRADLFRIEYTVGRSWEKKSCIWSDGEFSCPEKSTGVMWVGVHGADSICAVTRARDLDVTRVHGGLVYETMEEALFKFRIAIIAEIEDLADQLSKPRKIVGRSIEKPFGVVSGIPCTDVVGQKQASSDEFERNRENVIIIKPVCFDEEKTIKFLQEEKKRAALLTSSDTTQGLSVDYDDTNAIEFLKYKMKSKIDFTLKETIQTAICAFQHLFQTEFKANEIEVSVVDLNYLVKPEEAGCEDSVRNLELCEIEDHLDVINRPSKLSSCSGGSQLQACKTLRNY